MTTMSEDRVIGLWASPFLHFILDEHESYRAPLADLATSTEGTDVLEQDSAAALWLRQQIDGAIAAYLDHWAESETTSFAVEARTLVFGFGTYQPLRNHPDAYLSGLYYVTAPQDLREDHNRYDADSNAISFYDPRFAMNMGAIANDPNANVEKQVRPKPGVMIIWPSYVDYFMHPNLSAEALIAFQFNAVLRPGT